MLLICVKEADHLNLNNNRYVRALVFRFLFDAPFAEELQICNWDLSMRIYSSGLCI